MFKKVLICFGIRDYFPLSFTGQVIYSQKWLQRSTPPKFNMKAENDGFPRPESSFPRGVFSGSMLNFRGVFVKVAATDLPLQKPAAGL